jgi:hypothetical protein
MFSELDKREFGFALEAMRKMHTREDVLAYMYSGPNENERREAGKIVMAERDQAEVLSLHQEEMEKNRVMHRQTQKLAVVAIVIGALASVAPSLLERTHSDAVETPEASHPSSEHREKENPQPAPDELQKPGSPPAPKSEPEPTISVPTVPAPQLDVKAKATVK